MSSTPLCVVGFDGFIDSIYQAVKKRTDSSSFEVIERREDFGRFITEAEGSCNIELYPIEQRFGGNAPLMADALLSQGCSVHLYGALGEQDIDPLFQPLTSRCERVTSLSAPGKTTAIEFQNGKIFLGHYTQLLTLPLTPLIPEPLRHDLEMCTLFANCNWTMLQQMTPFWRELEQELLPQLSKKERWMFVDLADPSKRKRSDLLDALTLLQQMNQRIKVILSLNVSEAKQVWEVINQTRGHTPDDVATYAEAISRQLPLSLILVHSARQVAAANDQLTTTVDCPFITNPRRLTGAGDTFNGVFCASLLQNRTLQEALQHAADFAAEYVAGTALS